MTREQLLSEIETLAPTILGRQPTAEDQLFWSWLSDKTLARNLEEWANRVEALVNERDLPEEAW